MWGRAKMTTNVRSIHKELTAPGAGQMNSFEKPLLAFDALSKLTKQFANDPNIDKLIEIMLLTLSGQFSVPNAFASLWHQGPDGFQTLYSATGLFKGNNAIANLVKSASLKSYMKGYPEPLNVESLFQKDTSDNIPTILHESGIVLIAPLWHKGKLIGLIGLGSKANKKPFDKDEFALFESLVHTIIPLIANSLLFVEITGLNSWYLNILDNIQQGIIVFDGEDRLIDINRAALDLLNTCAQEQYNAISVKGTPLNELFPANVFPKWAARILKIKSGAGRGIVDNLAVNIDEKQRIYNARISVTNDRSNAGRNLIITMEDVTSQKENEVRFFELEKLAEKGLIASSISHELNNYLGMIVGGVELTQLVLSKGDTQRAAVNLEKISGNLDKMERFVKGLLNYGVLKPRKSLTNLNSIVSDVLLFITIQSKFKNISIDVDCHAELPDLELDIDQISQLLLNLINNSADAINETENIPGHISICTALEDNAVVLLIKDDGAGIKPEVKAKLFKSRFTTKRDGHGFGLATCAQIVGNHNGTINVESEIGIGTTFILRFPLDDNNKSASAQSSD